MKKNQGDTFSRCNHLRQQNEKELILLQKDIMVNLQLEISLYKEYGPFNTHFHHSGTLGQIHYKVQAALEHKNRQIDTH